MSEDYAQEVARDLRTGIATLNDWVPLIESDPGKALAHMTWLGLALAQKCQELSESVIDELAETAERRFFSMDGALFRSNGSVVTASREYFTILDLPEEVESGA